MIRLHALSQVIDSIIKRPEKRPSNVFRDESPLSDKLIHQLVGLSTRLIHYTHPKLSDSQEKIFYSLASAFSIGRHEAEQCRDGRIAYSHLEKIIQHQLHKQGIRWNSFLAYTLKHNLPYCAWLAI